MTRKIRDQLCHIGINHAVRDKGIALNLRHNLVLGNMEKVRQIINELEHLSIELEKAYKELLNCDVPNNGNDFSPQGNAETHRRNEAG